MIFPLESARVHSTESPGTTGPTPEGVPVRIVSPSCKAQVSVSIDDQVSLRPTSSVMTAEVSSSKRGILKIMSPVVPSCLVSPLISSKTQPMVPLLWMACPITLRVSLILSGSGIDDFGMKDLHSMVKFERRGKVVRTNPIGVNVSKPFAAVHGRPAFLTLSWRLRPVMSTDKAYPAT
jgi:hypothetical protein